MLSIQLTPIYSFTSSTNTLFTIVFTFFFRSLYYYQMSETKTGNQFKTNPSDCVEIVMGDDPATNGLAPETIWDVLKKTVATRGSECKFLLVTLLNTPKI